MTADGTRIGPDQERLIRNAAKQGALPEMIAQRWRLSVGAVRDILGS